jgi:hypothetical protein
LLAISTVATGAFAQTSDDAAETSDAAPAPEGSVGGFGDVNLFPKRVVIDGRRQIATVGLYNKTANEGDYEISVVDMAMTPEGRLIPFNNGLTEEQKAGVKTASPFLRYSPRRVTLRGSESQVVRIMARASSEIEPGEYRSHFNVTAIPRDNGDGFSIDDAVGGAEQTGIGVTIRPRFGISIPVIVRIGETTLDVGVREAALLTAQDGSQAVGIILTRSGNRSAFGDIVVTTNGSDVPVTEARGVGIYPEVGERQIILPLNPDFDKSLLVSGRTLSITYTDDDVDPGKTLAEHSLIIP